MKSITTDELKNKLLESNPVQIVDVRTDEETAMGYIPNAKLIPMDTIPDNLDVFN
ncbi:TPA: rhodanese-like domain-containing protein, partial [Staphylococcus aureus]|nr:rhodanese-like domain-containing protein [Staphylococcus aureus]